MSAKAIPRTSFIVHGDKDFVVPMNQSKLLHVVKGGGYGFPKVTPANDEIVKKVMDFFDSQFKTAK